VKIHGKIYLEFAILREDVFLDTLIGLRHPKPVLEALECTLAAIAAIERELECSVNIHGG